MKKPTKYQIIARDVRAIKWIKNMNRGVTLFRFGITAAVCVVLAADLVRVVKKQA